MIIALEGLDGCGKTTHAAALAEEARRRGRQASWLHFPTKFPEGRVLTERLIRDILGGLGQHEFSDTEIAVILQSLMVTNRLEVLEELRAAAERDEILVLDRYTLSAVVYGQADKLPRPWILGLQAALPSADTTIIIDISIEESFRRRPQSERDAYETDRKRLRLVKELYLDEHQYARACGARNVYLLDGERSKDDVRADIFNIVFEGRP